MQNKQETFTVALTNTVATNILNPPTTTGGVGFAAKNTYFILHNIRIINKTANVVTYSFYRGLTAAATAGTECIGTAVPVPPNFTAFITGSIRLDTTQFLVGGASAATSLTFECDLEFGIA